MVQKIKGKNNKTNVHHLKEDGPDTLTFEQDISNKLGRHFQKPLLHKSTIVLSC